MNKYYTPEAGELTIGMEVELLHSTNGWVKYINPDIKPLDANSLKEGVRVKCLDREDIESLGYGIIQDEHNCQWFKNANGNIEIGLENDYHLTIRFTQSFVLFSGTIKNKSELINQLKRCGI